MFAQMHQLDVTRLMALGQPLPYIYILAVPFLYLFTLPPAVCLFRPATDPLTSNKLLTPAGNPPPDRRLFFGILTGTFVLAQSSVPNMVYLSVDLLHSTLFRHPL